MDEQLLEKAKEKWVSEKKRLIDQVIQLSNTSFVLLLQNKPIKTSYPINKEF